jgi:hypothetical protein
MRFLTSISDAIVDRSPEELIGALLLSSVVAVGVASIYALRRRKSSPPLAFVAGLALAASVLCMAVGAGTSTTRTATGIPDRR